MGEVTSKRFPWEPVPVQETVALLQRDLAYVVKYTAVLVHCEKHPPLEMLVNTARGQIIPKGTCRFTDGATLEFQDIGAPQPGAPVMTVQELINHVWTLSREIGLEMMP